MKGFQWAIRRTHEPAKLVAGHTGPYDDETMGRSMSASAPMAALVRLGQHAIDRSLRDKIAFGVGEPHGQFPRRELYRNLGDDV